MIVTFEKEYLRIMFITEKSDDKKHRYPSQVISKYIDIINLMKVLSNPSELIRFKGLHFEKLIGRKKGMSSVRVNRQYRIEFEVTIVESDEIVSICNIIDLSNHYE